MTRQLSEQWVRHLGDEKVKFPRDMMYFTSRHNRARFQVNNLSEYVTRIEENVSRSDLYVAVYSKYNATHGLADKIFIDIDSEDLYKAYEDACSMDLALQDRYNVQPSTYFTGSKGYAMYLYFDEGAVDMRAIRKLTLDIAKEIGVELDTTVLGERSRVSRIPFTFNFKTLSKGIRRACVPVDLSWGFERIIRESTNPEIMLPVQTPTSSELRKELEEIAAKLPEPSIAKPMLASVSHSNNLVAFLMERAHRVEDGRHRVIDFLLIRSLIMQGLEDSEILGICKEWLEKTGKSWSPYHGHVQQSLKRQRSNAGQWGPWSLQQFFMKYPELMDQFMEEGQ